MLRSNTRWLRTVAFVSGAVVLGVEVTSFRIMAPYFGSSIFTTTNLLGVILGALALGYWLGGRAADRLQDRQRSSDRLHQLLVATALVVGALPMLAPMVLSGLRDLVGGLDWSLIVVSLGGSALLFFVPFVLLGMVSPWLVRLSTEDVRKSGRVAGSLFAWSTLGSLLGTFLPTLLLVPLLGTKRTILLLAVALALIGAIGLLKRRWLVPAVLLVVLVPMTDPRYFADAPSVVVEREGAAEYLRVVQEGSRVHLEQDEGFGVHSVYDPSTLRTGMVFDWLAATPLLLPGSDLRVGIIGLAGGTVARQMAAFFGPTGADPRDLSLAGVELDPETVALARRFFALDEVEPSMTVATGDGRVWLEQQERFDVLVVDAFRQLYIPPHLSSREFFVLASERLNPGGVVAVNLNVVGEDSLVEQKLSGTLRDVFPSVLAVRVPGSFNIVYYASNEPLDPERARGNRAPELSQAALTIATTSREVQPADDPWLIATDDRPLVEGLYDAMVASALLTSGSPGE